MIREGQEYCAGTNIQILKCDGYGILPIVNVEFDYAFSIITFQHIPNTETVIGYVSEMHRLLKTNGVIKFQILKNDEFPERDLWSYHNPEVLTIYMEKIGFSKIKIIDSGRWLFIEGINSYDKCNFKCI